MRTVSITMTRRQSREAAVQLLFEYSFCGSEPQKYYGSPQELLRAAENSREEKFSDFTRELFLGVNADLNKIDSIISDSADNWRISRISKVALAVLRLCVHELLSGPDDKEIYINEALELTRTDRKSTRLNSSH